MLYEHPAITGPRGIPAPATAGMRSRSYDSAESDEVLAHVPHETPEQKLHRAVLEDTLAVLYEGSRKGWYRQHPEYCAARRWVMGPGDELVSFEDVCMAFSQQTKMVRQVIMAQLDNPPSTWQKKRTRR